MSDRDELIAKARESMRQVRTIPWAYRYNGKHEVRSESVTSADGKGGLLIADRLPVEEAQYIANASVLLPALADLAESEGRRADEAEAAISNLRRDNKALNDLVLAIERTLGISGYRAGESEEEICPRIEKLKTLAALKGKQP